MSIQTIRPAGPGTVARPAIGDQLPAFEALAALAEAFPRLPRPYVTVHTTTGTRVGLQFDSPGEFEEWRAALGIDPGSLTLHSYGGSQWLAGEAVFGGVSAEVTGHGLVLSAEQLAAPAEVSA